MTGLEVKRGRREFGDVDTYDFKLQCSGMWQDYMGLPVLSEVQHASKECPAGMMVTPSVGKVVTVVIGGPSS